MSVITFLFSQSTRSFYSNNAVCVYIYVYVGKKVGKNKRKESKRNWRKPNRKNRSEKGTLFT